ncbi:MAG TPA: beta-ketoacyl synthase chain length factor [Cellvibrio sp.]|nr:beta-ketoacyl synthase chain length factor [Cellvibrio sp.]
MLRIYIESIGLAAPGLPSWSESQAVLRAEAPYSEFELEKYKPEQLPPNERRRATELVRMVFRVCEDMMNNSQIGMAECASVFASSGGDYPIIDQICKALCEPERQVSPTQFHNSVHNSAAGYWSIATESQLPSTSISAYDDTFFAGLLEAASLCCSENLPCILAIYDIKPPVPLNGKRKIDAEFGAAFLLSPQKKPHSLVEVTLERMASANAINTPASTAALEKLRLANPAARTLPLLELIASGKPGTMTMLSANHVALQIDVLPCN